MTSEKERKPEEWVNYCEICNHHKDIHHVVIKGGKKKLICEKCGLCSEIHVGVA